jgi:hypothetical protein
VAYRITPARSNSALARRADLDEGVAASYWCDAVQNFCRQYGFAGDGPSLRSFVGAMIVARVPYQALTRFPYDLAFGLTHGHREPSAQWRETLKLGAVAPPIEPRNQIRQPEPSQVMISRPW